MMPINKKRMTNQFCILGNHLRDLTAIAQHFGGDRNIIAVAYDPNSEHYTVRAILHTDVKTTEVHDFYLYLDALKDVVVVESEFIC